MAKVTAIVVGTGGMARHHIRCMLDQKRTTRVVGFVEISEAQREATRAVCRDAGAACPPFYETINELVKAQGIPDVAFICTPHKFHFENARDCLKHGMDVLLEKPMVMNSSEARRLIRLRDQTGRLVVVGFPGSISETIQKAKQVIREGAIGRVTAINAYAHQHWKVGTTGRWRQDPEISGGGFLFDTGSHMVNTVVDLLDEDVVEVKAFLDRSGTPVEINASISGRSRSGIFFTMTAAGDSILCGSEVLIFGDQGILQTGIWGERLNIKTSSEPEWKPVKLPPPDNGVWGRFLKVRNGKLKNPCPPEIGLRFAKLMEMIRKDGGF